MRGPLIVGFRPRAVRVTNAIRNRWGGGPVTFLAPAQPPAKCAGLLQKPGCPVQFLTGPLFPEIPGKHSIRPVWMVGDSDQVVQKLTIESGVASMKTTGDTNETIFSPSIEALEA